MHVLITGAAGMIGRKLIASLAVDQALLGADVGRLTLADVAEVPVPAALQDISTALTMDLSRQDDAGKLVAGRPDLIIHLAAVVSGEAEADFEKGYAVP